MPTYLSGLVCAFHPAATGSSPKHTIYAFIILIKFVLHLSCEKNENKQKEARFGQFMLKATISPLRHGKVRLSQVRVALQLSPCSYDWPTVAPIVIICQLSVGHLSLMNCNLAKWRWANWRSILASLFVYLSVGLPVCHRAAFHYEPKQRWIWCHLFEFTRSRLAR